MAENDTQKNSIAPVLLCIAMIVGGALIAFFGNNQNDLQRFCFINLIALGAGLGAAYLTGTISGRGTFGFITIQSVGGGFAVWLIVIATFIHYFPLQQIDGKSIPNMAGKWIYICTGHDGKYQHGGRFIATQNGNIWTLEGERMWRDTFNTKEGKWDSSVYSPTRSWHSLSGNLDEKEIRCEYIVENVDNDNIHGYFHGPVTLDGRNNVVKVKGTFNQLYPSKQISGDIEFYRVTDEQYNAPKWQKNHICGK